MKKNFYYYFKGLEQKLSEGYHVIVCRGNGVTNQVIAYTVSSDNITLENKSVNENIITCLNEMSLRTIEERPRGKSSFLGRKTLIDLIICSSYNYTLHFYKLANKQVLTVICKSSGNQHIPIKSIITENIKSGIDTMNALLKEFHISDEKEIFLHNFYGETYKHFRSVVEYQKTIGEKK